MKTHAISKILRSLADILEKNPNVELSELDLQPKERRKMNKDQIAVNLETLHALSRIKKPDWMEMINDYGFNIDIATRDSARNIIGKLLNFLDSNPDAINKLRTRSRETLDRPSPLSQALDILLKDVE